MNEIDRVVRIHPRMETTPRGLPLVAALTGLLDTGSTIAQLNAYLQENIRLEPVAIFQMDELYDYRGRRPTITFDQTHLVEYEKPELALSLATDDVGGQFLFLHGAEPDFRWEAVVGAIESFVDQLEISSFTWAHSIPMPAPHTRPIQVTVSGNRDDLIERYSIWRPKVEVPANLLHVLEFTLANRMPSAGFVLLIPHYLGENAYPDAAIKAIEMLCAATGLILPTDELREEGREFLRKLDEQIDNNEELSAMVHGLEERHDAFMAGVTLDQSDDIELATGEQIAAEWEQFLARRQNPEPNSPPNREF